MKKVNLDLFNPGEYMYMDIGRFITLEQLTGKPVGEIVRSANLDIGFIVNFLVIAMRHHGNRQSAFYIGKIQEQMEEMDQFDIEKDLQEPIVKCIVASGILGKAAYYAMFPKEITPEAEKEVKEEKN